MEQCTSQEQARIKEIYGFQRENKTDEMQQEIIELMNKYDCKSWTRNQVENYANQAKAELTKIVGLTTDGRAIFEDAIDLIINREL